MFSVVHFFSEFLVSLVSYLGLVLKCFQAQSIANQQRGHEFLFSCVTCFLGILDNLIRYFNKWAFVQVRCGTPLHDISVLGFVGSICHSLREVHCCKKSLVFSLEKRKGPNLISKISSFCGQFTGRWQFMVRISRGQQGTHGICFKQSVWMC